MRRVEPLEIAGPTQAEIDAEMLALLNRDESRKNWGMDSNHGPLNLEQIRAGAILRIADATEKMAERHTELIRDRDCWERRAKNAERSLETERHRSASLRGPLERAKKMMSNVASLRELREENKRLKGALFFWLPNIPAIENDCTERMANDAALLIGHEGRIDDSAEQRGWVVLTHNSDDAMNEVSDK